MGWCRLWLWVWQQHTQGEKAKDNIFVMNARAQEDAKINGKENVLNGTLGSIMDEEGNIVFLKAVEKEYLNLPRNEYVAYAPIAGLPEFLEAAKSECLANPDRML